MLIRTAYRFRMEPPKPQAAAMARMAGCCRFVWNEVLARERFYYKATGKYLGYAGFCGILKRLKADPATRFLNDAHSQALQQKLKDLDAAFMCFFDPKLAAEYPKFKRKGQDNDSFRYPQGFKLDQGNSRVYLPKIGWVRYRNSRKVEGTPKNVTVSFHAGHWFVSIQTEREVEIPAHPHADSAVGIDMGVARTATLSDGTIVQPTNALKRFAAKLAKAQRRLKRMVKFSKNWRKQQAKVARIYAKIANVRKDALHKATTAIAKNHGIVIVEALRVQNMTKSAKGTVESPGRNVAAKSGLNKAILDQGWGEFRRQLAYKLAWSGGHLVEVPAPFTSQRCSRCGHVDKANRPSQAVFRCRACGYVDNADHNASLNILAAGRAVIACGADTAQAPAMKQEPASEFAA